MNGCTYFAWIINIVNVVSIDEMFYGHVEETCINRREEEKKSFFFVNKNLKFWEMLIANNI